MDKLKCAFSAPPSSVWVIHEKVILLKMASNSQHVVENVLKQTALLEKKLKTTEVTKDIDVELDPGNLLSVDPNPINVKEFR